MEEILKRIYEYSLEDIMGERFGRYSKTIIQDRALPDVRDGLKPVQRRILYAMYEDNNTYEKSYKKSAKTVGNVMGFYHPHGDSSIYDAMVRMSQWWKQNTPYIDMHGNNGSMDGDSPAAMRYTEAKLSKISNELLKDIKKDTVMMTWNYDDTLKEPTVLPAKYPNLLVNGSTGISAGYATNIPTHNLGEVIDATIKRIDNPNCRLETLMELIPGPDFPTGGIVEGKNGIEEAFRTGRGKIFLKANYHFEKNKGRDQIIVSEIPFDVNKGALVKKIDDIRIDKKVEGILEVRDESDLEHPETIVIDLKKEADQDLIINYLLKNTELQISYNYNMVAIVNRRPMTLGLIEILDAYIEHQKCVIVRRTQFDLDHARDRMHIVDGLIKALSILDQVIKTIRSSKNKIDAKENLIKEYEFTERQAEAIVMLQLYKLTNTDVTELLTEKNNLELIIKGLEQILADPDKLKGVMKEELRSIKKEYAVPRKSEIRDQITEIKIDTLKMIPKEDCIVVVTHEGYVKRVSKRSYKATDGETQVKEGDYVIGLYETTTMDTLLVFTDRGNYLYLPIYEIPDLKWKDLGKHVSNMIKIGAEEAIIGSFVVSNFDEEKLITMFSKNGMIKRTLLSEFKVTRYSKPLTCMKLKEDDRLIHITDEMASEIFIATEHGFGLRYQACEVAPTGIKASGIKAISLKNDTVISGHVFENEDFITVITRNGTGKRIHLSEFEPTSRARKGILLVRDVKTNPYFILKTFIGSGKEYIGFKIGTDIEIHKMTELSIVDRYSTGTVLTKKRIEDAFSIIVLQKSTTDEIVEMEVPVSLDQVDHRIMTIDDFLDDFNIDE